jgi:hypothetical protein
MHPSCWQKHVSRTLSRPEVQGRTALAPTPRDAAEVQILLHNTAPCLAPSSLKDEFADDVTSVESEEQHLIQNLQI